VLRDVETYGGGLIAYSLGNFVGDMTWNSDTRLGGCLLVEMDGTAVRSHRLALTRIGRDYLPEYLAERDSAKAVLRMARNRQRQAKQIEQHGYDAIVAAEHRRQVRSTAFMMARNIYRYPRGALLPMIRGALWSRLRGLAS
jgi:poly-gamma-glutamate capsule biosynthesis protein CapA/YwtB (metallophosphatase superfamily)